ncbi:MAG TPA: tRNA (adenosine(37)-N6)-threonylcarbamoyltransferase complex dimerization subunit type 1 TsaB, partial [Vicinamibacterales bacterium]|nr:tRNA (adenosine(37)-N6)-threonylcarbamoyltransferase complex dimerization subunit type 1 TsaB [Vicinamibacterales bacterium]
PMIVLALDTTTRGGSIAVARDGVVCSVLTGDPARPHAERLPGDLTRALAGAGLSLAQVDVFAVAAGPGSFTGLRIGIAAIQGCAFASGKPVIGVSALEALALAAPLNSGTAMPSTLGVWMDAQRQEVFSELFARDSRADPARLEVLEGPQVGAPRDVADRWRSAHGGLRFPVVGDGAVAYRGLLLEAAGGAVEIIAPPPLAPTIAVMAWRRAAAGERPLPHAVRPLYVRRPDAELARDRAGGGA